MSEITKISEKKIFYKNFPNEGHYISEPKSLYLDMVLIYI